MPPAWSTGARIRVMLHHHDKKPHHTFMYLWLLGGVAVLISGMAGYVLNNPRTALAPEVEVPVVLPQTATTTLMLSLGEPGAMPDSSIVIDRVTVDSRCPSDVQCIQAGTVELSATVTGPNGTSTLPLSLGVVSTTEHLQITLTDVVPTPLSTTPIDKSQYRFTLLVETR